MLYLLLQSCSEWLDEIGLYRFVQVMYQLEFRAFAAVLVSFGIVLLFGDRVIRWLLRQKVGDSPEFYNKDVNEMMKSKAGTPTMGGIMIAGSLFVTTLLLADLSNRLVQLSMVVLIWLSMLGGFDDWLKLTSARRNPGSREGLYAWEKLLFQLGIGFIVGVFLYRYGDSETAMDVGHVLTLPFQRTYVPGSLQLETGLIFLSPVLFVVLAMLTIGGTSNAVNLTDGMDGLAAGTIVIASFAFMVVSYVSGQPEYAQALLVPSIDGADEIMVVTGSMAGACLGFLWFNCSPARVFMGDTGSLPLGGLLAYVAVAVRQEILLLLIGAVFFMEIASVVMQVGYFKWTKGKRVFRMAPIHHHFHLGGWSEQQVVTRFWLIGVIAAMMALVTIKLR